MSRDSRDYSSGRRKYEEEEPPTLYEIYKGEVVALQPYGAFIKLDGFRKNGLVHKTQISKARVDNPSEVLDLGDKVFCKVISFGEEGGTGKISLSMKVVNQDNGHDLDSNQVQTKQEEQRRQKGLPPTQDRIELGAVLNTTCRKCGMKGHLMQDCFHSKDGKTYDLIPDIDFGDVDQSGKSTNKEQSSTKKRKKKKKDRTREDRTREDKTREDRTKEDRIREDRTKEDRTREDRTKEDRTREDRTKEDRTKEDRTREDRTKEDRTREDRTREDRNKKDRTREEVHHNVERRKEREEQRHQSRLPSREANKDLGVGDKRKHSQRRGTPSDSDTDSDSSSGCDSKRRKDERNRSSKRKEGHSATLERHCKEVDQGRRKKKKSHKKDTRHSTDSSASSDDSTSSPEDEHRRKKKKKKQKHSKSYKE